MEHYIIHCDMNNYFASVEMLDNPYLENIPLVVCGDIELRHGIVLSKNNLAKEYGIVTGESYYAASQKCKNLVYIKADYKKYYKYTQSSRNIYQRYSNLIYPYGLDEAWIDITASCTCLDDAIRIAKEIKTTIYNELKLRIAVGVSYNYIFAKLASDQKVKDVFVIEQENFEKITEYFPAFSLLFVGSKTRTLLKNLDILTIGDLRKADPVVLKHYLGKKGLMLHEFACGDDSSFVPIVQNNDEIKSVSNTITSPKDVINSEEIEAFIYVLSQVVSKRLIKHNLSGKTVCVTIKLNDFTIITKQKTLDNYINLQIDIYNIALYILRTLDYEKAIRSFSLRVSNLQVSNYTQLSLFLLNNDSENIDKKYQYLKDKYGEINIEKTSNLKDWDD